MTKAQRQQMWADQYAQVSARVEANAHLGNSPEATRIRADGLVRQRTCADLVRKYGGQV